MTSEQLVSFVERKLQEQGIKKLVPGHQELAQAYRLFLRSKEAEQIIERELKKLAGSGTVEVPSDVENRVREYLMLNPEARWDAAVQYLVANASKLRRAP